MQSAFANLAAQLITFLILVKKTIHCKVLTNMSTTDPLDSAHQSIILAADKSLALLQQLPALGKLTTIVIQGGCVFEYKGDFPPGEVGMGFYNLQNNGQGFEGHIKLESIDRIQLESKLHRGRQSYAFVFYAVKGLIFKVFLGRDKEGELLAHQVNFFKQLASGKITL